MSEFVRMLASDGNWSALLEQWKAECEEFEEDFDAYVEGTFPVIEPLTARKERNAGVFAVKNGSGYAALCQINSSPLPGYTGKVMRVRFVTFSPKFDFGPFVLDEYANVLGDLFYGALELSGQAGAFSGAHLKFHLRSPAERTFFNAIGVALRRDRAFQTVDVKGTWLYISKAKPENSR